jgi:hypothetical protein
MGLLFSFFKRCKAIADHPAAFATYLAGLGVIVVTAVNSMTDHMSVNRWYFNVIWSIVWYSYFCSRAAQQEPVPVSEECETTRTGTAVSRGISVPALIYAHNGGGK